VQIHSLGRPRGGVEASRQVVYRSTPPICMENRPTVKVRLQWCRGEDLPGDAAIDNV
jgi:hypothetical protein